jgi:hypothetical protein
MKFEIRADSMLTAKQAAMDLISAGISFHCKQTSTFCYKLTLETDNPVHIESLKRRFYMSEVREEPEVLASSGPAWTGALQHRAP